MGYCDDGGEILINRLTAQDVANPGDMVPIWSQSAQDTRRVTVGALSAAAALANGSAGGGFTSQYDAPSASPFTVSINNTSQNWWLILTPTGTMAVGTINLPPAGTAVDHQEVLVVTTQAITALTVLATGLNVTGAPTTMNAGTRFRMKFDAVTNTWYIS